MLRCLIVLASLGAGGAEFKRQMELRLLQDGHFVLDDHEHHERHKHHHREKAAVTVTPSAEVGVRAANGGSEHSAGHHRKPSSLTETSAHLEVEEKAAASSAHELQEAEQRGSKQKSAAEHSAAASEHSTEGGTEGSTERSERSRSTEHSKHGAEGSGTGRTEGSIAEGKTKHGVERSAANGTRRSVKLHPMPSLLQQQDLEDMEAQEAAKLDALLALATDPPSSGEPGEPKEDDVPQQLVAERPRSWSMTAWLAYRSAQETLAPFRGGIGNAIATFASLGLGPESCVLKLAYTMYSHIGEDDYPYLPQGCGTGFNFISAARPCSAGLQVALAALALSLLNSVACSG